MNVSKWTHARRVDAIDLHLQGYHPRTIADEMDTTEGSVRWVLRECGYEVPADQEPSTSEAAWKSRLFRALRRQVLDMEEMGHALLWLSAIVHQAQDAVLGRSSRYWVEHEMPAIASMLALEPDYVRACIRAYAGAVVQYGTDAQRDAAQEFLA